MHGGVYLAGRLTGLGTDVYHWTIRCKISTKLTLMLGVGLLAVAFTAPALFGWPAALLRRKAIGFRKDMQPTSGHSSLYADIQPSCMSC